MTLPELEETIAKVKSRTDKPFGVNMRADQSDVMKRVQLLIREKITVASFAQAPGERKRVQLLIREKITVASFAQAPGERSTP